MSCASTLGDALQSLRGIEGIAVLLAIVYIVGAAREQLWCWYAALISTAIYTWLYWDVTLYMESGLNVYYMAMALYGWYSWGGLKQLRGAGGQESHASTLLERPIIRWGWRQHAAALSLIAALTLISAALLQQTDAAHPYLDSFTTWGAVVTTWMVARKVLENWLYWIVINAVGIWLNYDRCLLLTAGLLCSYQVISIVGFRAWHRTYRQHQLESSPDAIAPLQ